MTANASSSSPAGAPERPARPERSTGSSEPPDRPAVDLVAAGLVPALPRAFLEGRDRDLLDPLRFLPPGELPDRRRTPPPSDRPRLAAALGANNQAYGHPAADELAARLAEPETEVVVTGQQPGLFGGPLYALSKMVAAARAAEALEAAGRRVVPVFWVADEDHDWSEVSRATFLTPKGPRTYDLGDDPDPLLPVGMRTLGPGVTAILDELAELRASERFASWVGTLRTLYRPDARFGEAFCRLAVAVLGERCPLLLDAMDPAVKAAQAPWLARLAERRAAWEEASSAADGRIRERGHALQVHPQRGVSPLFQLHGGERRRIEWLPGGGGLGSGEDRYRLRGADGPERPVDDLLETIADNPGVVSPGVLARPAIQDAILGTSLQLLGPGELSYMGQAAASYRALELDAPWIAARPQVLVLESHHREKLQELEVPLAALLGPADALERLLAGRDGAGFVERARERIEETLEGLRAEALELDSNLERPLEKTRDHVRRSLETFAGKATTAAARRDEVRARRVERLRQVCLPGGALQERTVAAAHFPGKYGERFAEALWDQMELDGRHLQVIEP